MADKPIDTEQLEELKKIYITTFTSESGKKVLADLERNAYIYGTTYSENSQNLARNEGRRQMVLHIRSMMRLDIEKIKELARTQGE